MPIDHCINTTSHLGRQSVKIPLFKKNIYTFYFQSSSQPFPLDQRVFRYFISILMRKKIFGYRLLHITNHVMIFCCSPYIPKHSYAPQARVAWKAGHDSSCPCSTTRRNQVETTQNRELNHQQLTFPVAPSRATRSDIYVSFSLSTTKLIPFSCSGTIGVRVNL